jgi:hypothetical protein
MHRVVPLALLFLTGFVMPWGWLAARSWAKRNGW